MKNFIILIGGPGLFKHCDKAHDQSWTNYIVPVQLAAQENLYGKQPDETVHWVVYEPPYRNRWKDDSVITKEEKKQDDGRHLHSIRRAAAARVLSKGASNYIYRIRAIAATNGIKYKGINSPDEFWTYLRSMKDDSISRVWYSGHASEDGLMLALIHGSGCRAAALNTDMILLKQIKDNKDLQKKFETSSKQASKFYGCYTEGFAKNWNHFFGVSAAGAINKIDFGVVNRPSNIVNIMERIEKTPTSKGDPHWTVYK